MGIDFHQKIMKKMRMVMMVQQQAHILRPRDHKLKGLADMKLPFLKDDDDDDEVLLHCLKLCYSVDHRPLPPRRNLEVVAV